MFHSAQPYPKMSDKARSVAIVKYIRLLSQSVSYLVKKFRALGTEAVHTSFSLWFRGYKTFFVCIWQWKGINRKQSTRWQHLSHLKAGAFFSLQKKLVAMKQSNLYLWLVLPSGGWQSLIGKNKLEVLLLPTFRPSLIFERTLRTGRCKSSA